MTRIKIAAILLVVAGAGFLVAEAVAASAWTTPGYSYAANYISDLEVKGPGFFNGRAIASPLWLLASAAYVINGLLLIAALLLLIARRGQQRLPVAIAVAGIASAAGLVFDGFVHEVPASSLPFHFAGALFIIFGGIVALALAAVYAARTGMHPVFVWVPALFAGIQLISTVILNIVPPSVVGIVERGSFYPVLIAEIVAGVLLLAVPSVFRLQPRPIGVSTEAQVAR